MKCNECHYNREGMCGYVHAILNSKDDHPALCIEQDEDYQARLAEEVFCEAMEG